MKRVILALTFLEILHLKPPGVAFSTVFFRDNFRTEVDSDVISGANVGQVDVDILAIQVQTVLEIYACEKQYIFTDGRLYSCHFTKLNNCSISLFYAKSQTMSKANIVFDDQA